MAATGEPTGEPAQIVNLGLASIRQLTTTADGSKLAYAAIKTISNLWWLPLDPDDTPAGKPSPLTRGTGRNSRPVFSPDGSRLAYHSRSQGLGFNLWILSLADGEKRQLTFADELG